MAADTNTTKEGQTPAPAPTPETPTPATPAQETTPPEAKPAVPAAAQPQVPPAGAPVQEAAKDQAKIAAEQLAGGLKEGMTQLQKAGVAGVFKKSENQPKVTMDEKLWAGLSYIPLVALISLIIKPDSGYVKLHGKQGLLIFLIFFICIFVYLVPFIGPVFGGLIQLGLFLVGLFSMYQAFIGNWWKIPVLGDLSEMFPVDLLTKATTEAVTGQPAPQQPPAEGEKVGVQAPESTQSSQSEQESSAPQAPEKAPPENK